MIKASSNKRLLETVSNTVRSVVIPIFHHAASNRQLSNSLQKEIWERQPSFESEQQLLAEEAHKTVKNQCCLIVSITNSLKTISKHSRIQQYQIWSNLYVLTQNRYDTKNILKIWRIIPELKAHKTNAKIN